MPSLTPPRADKTLTGKTRVYAPSSNAVIAVLPRVKSGAGTVNADVLLELIQQWPTLHDPQSRLDLVLRNWGKKIIEVGERSVDDVPPNEGSLLVCNRPNTVYRNGTLWCNGGRMRGITIGPNAAGVSVWDVTTHEAAYGATIDATARDAELFGVNALDCMTFDPSSTHPVAGSNGYGFFGFGAAQVRVINWKFQTHWSSVQYAMRCGFDGFTLLNTELETHNDKWNVAWFYHMRNMVSRAVTIRTLVNNCGGAQFGLVQGQAGSDSWADADGVQLINWKIFAKAGGVAPITLQPGVARMTMHNLEVNNQSPWWMKVDDRGEAHAAKYVRWLQIRHNNAPMSGFQDVGGASMAWMFDQDMRMG